MISCFVSAEPFATRGCYTKSPGSQLVARHRVTRRFCRSMTHIVEEERLFFVRRMIPHYRTRVVNDEGDTLGPPN